MALVQLKGTHPRFIDTKKVLQLALRDLQTIVKDGMLPEDLGPQRSRLEDGVRQSEEFVAMLEAAFDRASRRSHIEYCRIQLANALKEDEEAEALLNP